jgi:hypothetical protein
VLCVSGIIPSKDTRMAKLMQLYNNGVITFERIQSLDIEIRQMAFRDNIDYETAALRIAAELY